MSSNKGKNKGPSFISAGKGFLKKLVYDDVPEAKVSRREARQPVAGEVVIYELDEKGKRKGSHRVFIRDLSKSGCGLWCRTRVEAGTRIAVIFEDKHGQPVQRMADICHCRGQEHTGFALGVRFTSENMPVPFAA